MGQDTRPLLGKPAGTQDDARRWWELLGTAGVGGGKTEGAGGSGGTASSGDGNARCCSGAPLGLGLGFGV